MKKIIIVPEVVYCSYCGRKIWAVIYPNTQPEELICDECKKGKIKEKE
jgi:hypothetical protein